jgi:hypothetical protein
LCCLQLLNLRPSAKVRSRPFPNLQRLAVAADALENAVVHVDKVLFDAEGSVLRYVRGWDGWVLAAKGSRRCFAAFCGNRGPVRG